MTILYSFQRFVVCLVCSLCALLVKCFYALVLLFLGRGERLHYTAGGQ